jgi:DNA-directed RNA polymerase subunit beta'
MTTEGSIEGISSLGLLNLNTNSDDQRDFSSLKISIASPEKIRSWSYGEISKPETINYRTFKPERDGLFCARIFGPIKDYECLCGKYKRMKYKGIVCEKCGVEVTSSKVRRDRMGHVELASPVVHIWFFKSLPSRLSIILDVTLKALEKVIYFESYIVTDSLMSPLEDGEIISEDEYYQYQEEYGYGSFEAGMGGEAIQKLLKKIDLAELQKLLIEDLENTNSELKKEKLLKRLTIVKNFLSSDNKLEHMVMSVMPVIPPDIRPLVMLDGGRFAASDLNELYRRVINRNNRLRRLMELDAPDMIIRNEKRMLQEAVDALLDNGRSGTILKNNNKKPFKSLSDMLKGKQGRFRQNLLGKRVDYSGRSVIVVGPSLRLHQCGLPKKMALELFKPFIYAKLELYGQSSSMKISKKMVEEGRPEVWDALDEIIENYPVLLNRAPTLHRLGIQAFEPILIEGNAIRLHPLVCAAFNADFDGDQMAVHVPLSIESQVEARVLMMSTNNILSPANGSPIIVPSHDIVLGLYYMTMNDNQKKEKVVNISGMSELEYALNAGFVKNNSSIRYRHQTLSSEGLLEYKTTLTTVGRAILHNILPESIKRDESGFGLVNCLMDKKKISLLIDSVYRMSGKQETVNFSDRLMAIGFSSATKSGISIGKDDMVIPDSKEEILQNSEDKVRVFNDQYNDGFVTFGERYNKIVDEWSNCTNKITHDMMEKIKENSDDPIEANSIYMMASSGARGSENQIKQVSGMRGLMAKPSGEIIETPIKSNFKEGLGVLEYFISAHGARKGLADTALKTANSGYLTRRLVDVAQDCIISEYDCKTNEGVKVSAVVEDSSVVASLSDQILGRTLAKDVLVNDKVLVKAGTLVSEDVTALIENSKVSNVVVRSALTCETKGTGLCSICYGRDLSTGSLVSVGEAVGVVAAQSIGEPGTQLTMRTFHVGGVATRHSEQSSISAVEDVRISLPNKDDLVSAGKGKYIVANRNSDIILLDKKTNLEIHKYRIPYGAKVLYDDGVEVSKGDRLVEWDAYNINIIAEEDGKLEYKDLIENISLKETIDESTGVSTKIVSDWKKSANKKLRPSLLLSGQNQKEYNLSVGAIIMVSNNASVKAGDIIAKVPKDSLKNKDITGGLPRVAELFEARKPKIPTIMSEVEGVLKFGKTSKTKTGVIIEPKDESIPAKEYMIPKEKHLFFNEGDLVKKGDSLIDGNPVPHDILSILGLQSFVEYMINEVQKVYRMQGVRIDNKHIEVILKMMLLKVEITGQNDSNFVSGLRVDREEVNIANKMLTKKSKIPASYKPLLLGITKSSLQTNSFISAASFQETTKVLTDSAVQGRVDRLKGLKENIIIGRLIPAGTGLVMRKLKDQKKQKRK